MTREWPGNGAPILRGSKEHRTRLDRLVQTLTVDCTYNIPSIPNVFFGPSAIRVHALAVLNERRRQIHSGHDYERVSTHHALSILMSIILRASLLI